VAQFNFQSNRALIRIEERVERFHGVAHGCAPTTAMASRACTRIVSPTAALTRATLQDELMRIVASTGATALMVTHDVDEAVLLSDRVVMMTNGPAATIGDILQVDLPRPRARLALAHDARFMDLRAAVLEFLYAKQKSGTDHVFAAGAKRGVSAISKSAVLQ